MPIKYYTEQQIDNLIYVQTPKVLLYGSEYKDMMPQAKLLYIALLDKLKMSMMKGWHDSEGKYYVIMSIEYGAEMLGFSHSTLRRCKTELKKHRLIEEKRVGLNQPNRIYVGRLLFTEDDLYEIDDSRSAQSDQSEMADARTQDSRNVQYEHSEVSNVSTHECQLRATYNNKSNNNKINNNENINIVNNNADAQVNNSVLNINKIALFKQQTLEAVHKYQVEFSTGRWDKKAYLDIVNKFMYDAIERGIHLEVNCVDSYVYGFLKKTAHHHDMKYGKKKFEGKSDTVLMYNWLEEGNEELPY
ncbi:replication initiator protein A [Bacillus mobilis]|uniref:replication initiator protein A n=1 Tax=Bacillus mobilis TaxID=2026190 RepID=UPI002E1C18A1|nr:replication initiator protein A [Bacillus mobilis]MED0955554.1 replication initiator protein A [Bacillus mobilis]